MPTIKTNGVKYVGFALCLLLTGLGLTAHGGDSDKSLKPDEVRTAAVPPNTCTNQTEAAAVNSCQGNGSSAAPATPPDPLAPGDALPNGESATFEAKTCKRAGKRCKIDRPVDCCSFTCLCPVGQKHCTCG